MRVRISMPGVYMAMEMEDEQARATFHKMAELMWLIGNKNQRQPEDSDPEQINIKAPAHEVELPVPSMQAQTEKEVFPLIEDDSDSEAEVLETPGKGAEEDTEVVEPKMISTGYGGFLYIKCPVCGKVKGFCAKTRLNNFRCECGSVTKLEHLVPLYMNCECGRNSRYLTNMEDPVFDIVCYDCGNPVPVSWNSKKKQYETIRG